MKQALAILCLSIMYLSSDAQFFDRIKNKVNQKVNDAVDKGIDSATKGKKGKSAKTAADSTATKTTDPVTGKAIDPVTGKAGDAAAGVGLGQQPEDIKAYSKFDFVPGEKIIVAEDFSRDAIGEFPDKWNTKTAAEVVTLNNRPGKWLCMKQDGEFFPEYIPQLPENFTLQVDLLTNNNVSSIASLIVTLGNAKDAQEKFDMAHGTGSMNVPGLKISLTPVSSGDATFAYYTQPLGGTSMASPNEFHVPDHNFVTLSVWRQKTRIRVYLNSTKMLDLPRALDPGTLINSLAFGAYAVDYGKKGGSFYLSNIRLSVGAPDTRNKLITEGKFVTHGILFDVNSDQIKAPSYGALQDIANALIANPAVHVKIVGHTDSDGDDAANLDLSRKRAEAVKAMLVANFNIDAARMTTEGKGETQPIDNNTTPEGKANNRRVEFIKG